MASDFTTPLPTWVIPKEPSYHLVVTESESQKKNFMNFSGSTPVYQYELEWKNITDDQYATILTHFQSTYGGYDSFLWDCVPSYIDGDHDGIADGTSMTGRWIKGSFDAKPEAHSWNVSLDFEEEVN